MIFFIYPSIFKNISIIYIIDRQLERNKNTKFLYYSIHKQIKNNNRSSINYITESYPSKLNNLYNITNNNNN